jgi:hypothetical protein
MAMRKKTPTPLKPLKKFDYKVISEKVWGLLINVDRDLRRRSGDSRSVDLYGDHAHLLNIFVRCAMNSYEAVLYFGGDIPEDPRRKKNFVIAIPPVNRQLLYLLFTIVYLLDDFDTRVRHYMRAGWREIHEEQHQIKTAFSQDPDYKAHIRNLDQLLEDLGTNLLLSEGERKKPDSLPYWPHPDKLADLPSQSRPFLRHLNRWFYHDTSAQSHLTFGGLLKISMFFLSEHIGGEDQRLIEDRFLQQFRGQQMSRTLMLTLAIATEADAYCQLRNQEVIRFIWPILTETFAEARELWDLRYRVLSESYSV